MALVTLGNFKTYAGITVNTDDSRITLILNGVSDHINRRTHRTLEWTTFDEKIDIPTVHEESIQLENFPVTSVIALTDDGNLIVNTDYVLYEEGFITLKERVNISHRFTRDRYFTKGPQKVEASYQAAYREIPDSLQLVNFMVTNRFLNKVGREELVSETIGNYSYRLASISKQVGNIFLPEEEALLAMFTQIT